MTNPEKEIELNANQIRVIGIVGLAMAAIFMIAMFIIKPKLIEHDDHSQFYVSVFIILGSLAFFGWRWFRSVGESIWPMRLSFGYFCTQLVLCPILWIGAPRPSIFLTIHFFVIAVFLIIYLLMRMKNVTSFSELFSDEFP